MANMLYNNLVYGETDVGVLGRPDLEPYRYGVSHLENFNVGILGGISRREGLKQIALKDSDNRNVELNGKTRIVEFVLSKDEVYLLLLSNEKLRVYSVQDNKILTELVSPYIEDVLDEIQYAQDSESVVFAHKDNPPYVFSIIGDVIAFAPINFLYDTRKRKEKAENEAYDYTNLFNNGDYPNVCAFAGSRLIFANTPKHPYRLFFSRPFEKENFTTFDTVAETTKEIKDLTNEEWSKLFSSQEAYQYLSIDINDLTEYITSHIVGGVINASYLARYVRTTIIPDLQNKGVILGEHGETKGQNIYTQLYNLDQAYSSYYPSRYPDGIPSYVALNAANNVLETLLENGDIREKVYESDMADIKFVQEDIVSSDCAVVLDIGGNKNDAINWIAVNQNIIVGTASSEWVMPLGINALEQNITQISAYGSRQIQAVASNDKVLYVQGAGYIGSVGYNEQSYNQDNLNIYNKNILKEGVVNLAWQRIETPRLFCLLKNGTLAVLTYNTLNGVKGWNRWTFGGGAKCLSVAVADSSSSQDVYVTMQFSVVENEQTVTKYGLFVFDKSQVADEFGDFDSILLTNPVESGNYSSIFNFKNGKAVGIRANETDKVVLGWTGSYLKEADFTDHDIALVPLPSCWKKDLRLCIKATGSNKANILAIVANMEIS